MGKYLVDVCGYSKKDASTLIAFYGNLRFCQVVNPQKTVRMEIDKQYMNLFKHKLLPF
jgi:acetamidase/formamidase